MSITPSLDLMARKSNAFQSHRKDVGNRQVERYFLQGFQRWHVEWIEVIGVEGLVLPTDAVLLSLQTIVGLAEGPRDTLDPIFAQIRLHFISLAGPQEPLGL
jgi:hypothetical protein